MKTPAMTATSAARACKTTPAGFKVAAQQIGVSPCRRDPRTRRGLYAVPDVERVIAHLRKPEILK